MNIASFVVNLDPGVSNASLLAVSGNLAEKFACGVIGFAGGVLTPDAYNEGAVRFTYAEQDLRQIEKQIVVAEAEFRAALGARAKFLEWRSAITYGSPSRHLVKEASCADLIVTAGACVPVRGAAAGDLVMEAGRPILTVPPGVTELALGHVLVAWKDTREARLAAAAALPLLEAASRVSVVTISENGEMTAARNRVDDVVRWLGRHAIAAEPLVSSADGDDAARMTGIAAEQQADLIVAGAYGHGRLREWVLGGFTRQLLANTERCSFVVH